MTSTTHASRTILAGIKNFSGYWWADDNSFLVYATQEEAGKGQGVTTSSRTSTTASRFPERRQALTLFFPESGVRQPLAAAATISARCASAPTAARCCWLPTARTPRSAPITGTPWYCIPWPTAAAKRSSTIPGSTISPGRPIPENCSCWAAPRLFPAWAARCRPAWSPTTLTSRPMSST